MSYNEYPEVDPHPCNMLFKHNDTKEQTIFNNKFPRDYSTPMGRTDVNKIRSCWNYNPNNPKNEGFVNSLMNFFEADAVVDNNQIHIIINSEIFNDNKITDNDKLSEYDRISKKEKEQTLQLLTQIYSCYKNNMCMYVGNEELKQIMATVIKLSHIRYREQQNSISLIVDEVNDGNKKNRYCGC